MPASSRALAVALFTAAASGNILTPLLPNIREDFQISVTAAGVTVAAFGLARLMVDVPSVLLGDRFSLRTLGGWGVGFTLASTVLGFVAPNITTFLASRVLAGVGVAIIAIVALTGMSRSTGRESRGRAMSLIQVANNTGIALYPLVGGLIGALFGWRMTFVLAGVLAAICGVVLLPTLARLGAGGEGTSGTQSAEVPEEQPALSPVRRRAAVLAVFGGVTANHIHRHGFRNTFVPLFGGTVLGLGTAPISIALALIATLGLIVAMPGGILSDRFGRRRIIVAGLLAIAVGDLVYIWTGDIVLFLVAAAIVGLGDFFSGSQAAMLSELVSGRYRTRALSGFRFSVDLGALIGPVVVAIALDAGGPVAAVLLTSGVLAVAAVANRIALPAAGAWAP